MGRYSPLKSDLLPIVYPDIPPSLDPDAEVTTTLTPFLYPIILDDMILYFLTNKNEQ